MKVVKESERLFFPKTFHVYMHSREWYFIYIPCKKKKKKKH